MNGLTFTARAVVGYGDPGFFNPSYFEAHLTNAAHRILTVLRYAIDYKAGSAG